MNTKFHLAFPVRDLELTKFFYVKILGCSLGRESSNWVDFNLFGHQIVAHYAPQDCIALSNNLVDGDKIPSRHFGVILNWIIWENLIKSIIKKGICFYIKPKVRFKNKKGEQGTFFVLDPSENVLEFKSFKNDSMVFER